MQLKTTPSLPGYLPLLIPREKDDRCGDQKPGALPVSIGRPLDTVFYTQHDLGLPAVEPTRQRDHGPPRRCARTPKAYWKDTCFAKNLSADVIDQHTKPCSGHAFRSMIQPTKSKSQIQHRWERSILCSRKEKSRNQQDAKPTSPLADNARAYPRIMAETCES